MKINVKRVKENPYDVCIKHANGLQLTEYSGKKDKLTMKLKGAGTSRIKLAAAGKPTVKLDGEEIVVKYNRCLELATVEVKMQADERKELEVRM